MPADPAKHQAAADTFTWTSLIGPAVVAAGISALVAWLTTSRRFAVDRELAERKIASDIGLAKQKAESDTALAERKFAFDKALVVWRRRYDLAEQVLVAAYEADDALRWARAPVTFVGEAATREPVEGESEKLKRKRDFFFIPLERLSNNGKIFATLQTLRYPVSAHFGEDALKPLGIIAEAHHGIMLAGRILVEHVQEEDDPTFRQNFDGVLQSIGRTPRPDATDVKVSRAIEQIEAICKPVLSAMPPS